MEAPATIPLKIIYLSSVEGQALLEDVRKAKDGFFQPILYAIFAKQVTFSGCGMQSAALLLSANSLGKQHGLTPYLSGGSAVNKLSIPYTELEMYNYPQTLAVTNQTHVTRHGLTLPEVGNILKSHGCSVKLVHASNSTPAEFRADTLKALSCSNSCAGIIVNFARHHLGQKSRGVHHSPLVAYHTGSDSVLVLDTANKMPDFWVSVEDLFQAMNTKDHTSDLSRGYCIAYK